MSAQQLVPGTRVRINYFHYAVEAVVVEPPTRYGWVTVEQDYEGEPIRYEAAVEHIQPLTPAGPLAPAEPPKVQGDSQ